MDFELKYRDLLELTRELAEIEEAFRKVALEIAHERNELCDGRTVIFEEKRVRFSCQGTGIYDHDEWFEEFPAELLLERMRTR